MPAIDFSSELSSLEGQEISEGDKPPDPSPRPARAWRVAVIANVKGETSLPVDAPADAGAEFDRKETIQAIRNAIESDGHSTIFIPADSNLPSQLLATCPDICFNLAEGIHGDSREAQVPALLEMLRIPYTASGVLANAVGLDKTMTKRIWRDAGLPTAYFQEFITPDDELDSQMRFPMFVKPAREGTGMGMDPGSIVHNVKDLSQRVAWVTQNYRQPALVEEYLPGREFTSAVLGKKNAQQYSHNPGLYESDGFHRFPVLEIDHSCSATPGVYGHYAKSLNFNEDGVPGFICPAQIPESLSVELQNLAIKAHQAIGALDVSRVDIRLDAEGQPRLMEINTLPGLSPGFSDLCVIASADGITYTQLILEILYLGASRHGLLPTHADLAAQAIPVHLENAVLTPGYD